MGISVRRLQSSLFRKVCRDVYVAAAVPDSFELRLQVAQLLLPDAAAISGRAAAWVHGVDILASIHDLVEIVDSRHQMPLARGILLPRESPLEAGDIVEVNGLFVTSPLRTAFDLARRLSLTEAVVAVDALWHAGLIEPDELLWYAADHPGWPGLRRLEHAVALADVGAGSPMESRLRMALYEGGLPRPVTQYKVPNGFGGTLAEVDIAYPERELGVEYDGHVHEATRQRTKDLRRHNRLQGADWLVLYYSAADYYTRKHVIIREVTEQWEKRG
jgi:hypothetical protein